MTFRTRVFLTALAASAITLAVAVTLAAVRPQLHLQAVVAETRGARVGELDPEDLAHLLRELVMGGAGEDGDVPSHGHNASRWAQPSNL